MITKASKRRAKTTTTDYSFKKSYGSSDMSKALSKVLGNSEHYKKPKNQRVPCR